MRTIESSLEKPLLKATSYTLEEVPSWMRYTRLQSLTEEYNFKYIFVSVYKYFNPL
jgi:hypothetical protein